MSRPTFLFLACVSFLFASACGPPAPKPPPPAPEPEPPTPTPEPKPGDVDGLGTPIGDACVNLRKIHCPEGDARTVDGQTRTCFQSVTFTVREMGVGFPVLCVTAAKTTAEVRGCGNGERELRVRCRGVP